MRLPWLIVLLIFGALGCGSGGPKFAPVSGQVTLDGKPLAYADIYFEPVAGDTPYPGPGSYGQTDEQGRFTLEVVGPDRRGAVVGKHTVSISAYEGEPPDPSDDSAKPQVNKVPARYNTESTIPPFDVPPAGTNAANFHLTSK